MHLTRRFWLAAVGTLVMMAGTASVQAQATKLLPNDTEMLITINLQQILKSEVLKSNKALVDLAKTAIEQKIDDNPAGKYLKTAGFNLFTDLASITIAVPGGRDFGEGLIVLEGKFDAEKIEAAATEASKEAGGGLKVIEIANTKAFQVTPKEDEKTIYVGVLNNKTMIACTSKTDFATAVTRLNGSQQPTFKAEVKALMKNIKKTQSLSVVATSAALLKLADKAPEGAGAQVEKAAEFLKQLDGFSASITIQKDIDFEIGVATKDNETAQKYAALSKAGLEFAKKMVADKAKDDEKFAAALTVINSIRATAAGTDLMIRGQITFETLEKILQNLPIGN